MKPLLRSMLAISVSSFILLVCSTVLVTRASSTFVGAVFGSLAVAVLVSLSAWGLFIRPKLHALQRLASGLCEFANRKFSTRMGPEGERFAWVVATNVYFKGAQGWRLVAHHASPGTASEVQDIAETASILH